MSLQYGFTIGDPTTSEDFSEAIKALVGDGITSKGAGLSAFVNGFTVTVSTGFALSAGRWVENTELLPLQIRTPSNNNDRTDAIVVRVDYDTRKAAIEVLRDVKKSEIMANPSILRNGDQYCLILYFVEVRRGATSIGLSDMTDMRESEWCGKIVPYSAISNSAIYVYDFLNGGIDAEVARLIALSNALIARAQEEINRLNAILVQKNGIPGIGELRQARKEPAPLGEWLLCNGSVVPAAYPDLSALLGGTLPNISKNTDRYRTYIYGGTPKTG